MSQQQLLAAQQQPALQPGQQTMMVHGYRAGSGDHMVDDSGNLLTGAPDANGMYALPVNSDGTYAGQSAFINLGPPYTDSATPFTGTPLAPPTWTGAQDDSGRAGATSGGAPPPGALDYGTYQDSIPANWQQFQTNNNTGTGAGFFTMDGFYGGQGKPVPMDFQAGSNLPSTNNWRLLPPAYRKSNYIMRNGRIIDMNASLRGPVGWEQYGGSYGGGNGTGYPSTQRVGLGGNWGSAGWPGSLEGWTTPEPGTKD